MELTYQREIQLPTQCCLLTEDEMTYLNGGEYSFSVGKYTVTFYPEVLGQYMTNLGVNFAYLIGAGAFSVALAGLIKGYKDGNAFAAVGKFWGEQNTLGHIAAIGVGVLAGYYVYARAGQIYSQVVSIIDSVKTWWDDYQAQKAASATVPAAA